jgi:tetratricopeptide (TPR) repeat protein
VHGEHHSHTAQCYGNLASCLGRQGKHAEALPLHRRALDGFLLAHGDRHPLTAQGYGNLASCLSDLGKHGEALPLYRRALDLSLLVHGERHPITATCDNNMAWCLTRLGKAGEALPLYRRALDVSLRMQGGQHPGTASSYNNLALCLDEMGRRAEGLLLLQASLPGQEAARFHGAATGFDRAAAARQASPHAMLAAGLAALRQPVNAYRHAEHALARGLLDDLSSAPPADRDRLAALAAEVRALQARLVPLLARGDLSDEEKPLRDQLERRRRRLEGEMGRLASAVSARQVLPLEQIQRHIPADAALVLWVDELGEHLGCVVRRKGPPAWARLPGSGKGGAWTEEDSGLPLRCYATLTVPGASASLREALYRQRLAPLERHLVGVKRLLVVPTGALARVPVEALGQRWTVSYVPSGSAFARAATRSRPAKLTPALVLADPAFVPTPAPPKLPAAPPHGLLIKGVVRGGQAARIGLRPGDVLLEYAGTALELPADLKEEGEGHVAVKLWRGGKVLAGRVPGGKLGVLVDARPPAEALAAWRAGQDEALGARSGEAWRPLPGTRQEARAIEALLGTATMLLGSAASEQALEELASSGKLGGYRLLHLATHGQANPSRPLDSALVLAQDRLSSPREQEARVLKGERPLEGRLTVQAVLSHWRLDADLVVLSACQSGLGQDARGEGMLGFAHALLQKGARSVVLSRWQVDDEATALLMVRFYQNLLGKRDDKKPPLPRAEALEEAKNWLRNLSATEVKREVERLRGKGKAPVTERKEARPFAHPYFWAAFVLVGDPN